MFTKTRKFLMLAGVAAMLAATPASAMTVYFFYDNGVLVGQYVFHDDGRLCERWGYATYTYYVQSYPGYNPTLC